MEARPRQGHDGRTRHVFSCVKNDLVQVVAQYCSAA